jgi:hypothetical protein
LNLQEAAIVALHEVALRYRAGRERPVTVQNSHHDLASRPTRLPIIDGIA